MVAADAGAPPAAADPADEEPEADCGGTATAPCTFAFAVFTACAALAAASLDIAAASFAVSFTSDASSLPRVLAVASPEDTRVDSEPGTVSGTDHPPKLSCPAPAADDDDAAVADVEAVAEASALVLADAALVTPLPPLLEPALSLSLRAFSCCRSMSCCFRLASMLAWRAFFRLSMSLQKVALASESPSNRAS